MAVKISWHAKSIKKSSTTLPAMLPPKNGANKVSDSNRHISLLQQQKREVFYCTGPTESSLSKEIPNKEFS
jgi:hypothetical protein